MSKATLRDEARRLRQSIAPETREAAGAEAQARVLALPEVREARTVFCYLSVRDEVGTGAILAGLADGARVACVPAFDETAGAYRPARWTAGTPLRAGRMGIPEPADPEWIDIGRVDVAVAPGLAFDERGGRLGYGGGNYDRMLGAGRCFRVGLSFEIQIVGYVPLAAHDVRMDAVVTERRVIRAR
jgi:5-formyltetrahydrofolate cyclo-ligase